MEGFQGGFPSCKTHSPLLRDTLGVCYRMYTGFQGDNKNAARTGLASTSCLLQRPLQTYTELARPAREQDLQIDERAKDEGKESYSSTRLLNAAG